MKPAVYDIDFTQQNDFSITVTFVDAAGSPIDYSTLDFEGIIKEQADIIGPEWAWTVDDTDSNIGVVIFSLTNADTDDMADVCEYEFRMLGATEIFTFLAGKARIRRSLYV